SPQGSCTVTLDATTRNATRTPVPDGTIDMNLDLDLGFSGLGVKPPDRTLLKLSGLSTLSTLSTQTCPTFTLTAANGQSWDWLRVDDPTVYKVSADGQSVEGTFSSTGAGGATQKSVWKFSAMRE